MPLTKYQRDKCLNIVDKFMKLDICVVFRNRVDPNEVPTYLKVISEPMCLKDVKGKLSQDKYDTIDDFKYDMNLIWKNCIKFNGAGTIYGYLASEAKMLFDEKIEKMPKTPEEGWLKKTQKYTIRLQKLMRCIDNEMDHMPTQAEETPV